MLVPYNVDVPMERIPIANWILIALTTMISTRYEQNLLQILDIQE